MIEKIKVKLDHGAYAPERAHSVDAGLDLRSPKDVYVPKSECEIDFDDLFNCGEVGIGSATIDTGVHVEIPEGYVGMLKSKSGLNVKHSILSEGVIDCGYTGSIVVKLYNLSDKGYMVHRGDKISQLVILPIITPEIELVENLEDTERGTGGFGSTGV